MSSDNITGYSLSRHWFKRRSMLYHLATCEIDGKMFNEAMSFVSLCRRERIINGELAYVFMRIFDDGYQIYLEKGVVKKRMRRNKALGFTSNEQVKSKVFELHGGFCLCCGTDENITLDHVVAVAIGGKDSVENLQPLCASCNSKKGTKIIDYRGIEI